MKTFMQKAGSDPLSCRGVGTLQTALSILPTSADENQVGLCLIGVSVNKGAQKLATQWLHFPFETLFQAGLCRCCSISPAPS